MKVLCLRCGFFPQQDRISASSTHCGILPYCGGSFHPVSRPPLEGIISNIVVNFVSMKGSEFRILLHTILNRDLDIVNCMKLGRAIPLGNAALLLCRVFALMRAFCLKKY